MPTWLPTFDNGMIAFLLGTVATFSGWYLRVMLPEWREQAAAKARKADAEASFLRSAQETQQKLTALGERQTQMHDANTQALTSIAHLATSTNEDVRDIYRHLLSGCECDNKRKQKILAAD